MKIVLQGRVQLRSVGNLVGFDKVLHNLQLFSVDCLGQGLGPQIGVPVIVLFFFLGFVELL